MLFLKERSFKANPELQKLYQEERSRFCFTNTDGDLIHLGMTGAEVAEALGETPIVEYNNFYIKTQQFPDHQLTLCTMGDLILALKAGEPWKGTFETEGEDRGFKAYDKSGNPIPGDPYALDFPDVHFLYVEPSNQQDGYWYRLLGIRLEVES